MKKKRLFKKIYIFDLLFIIFFICSSSCKTFDAYITANLFCFTTATATSLSSFNIFDAYCSVIPLLLTAINTTFLLSFNSCEAYYNAKPFLFTVYFTIFS